MFRFISAIEGLTTAINRFMDFWEGVQQKEVDQITGHVKATNDRLDAKLQEAKRGRN